MATAWCRKLWLTSRTSRFTVICGKHLNRFIGLRNGSSFANPMKYLFVLETLETVPLLRLFSPIEPKASRCMNFVLFLQYLILPNLTSFFPPPFPTYSLFSISPWCWFSSISLSSPSSSSPLSLCPLFLRKKSAKFCPEDWLIEHVIPSSRRMR